MKNSQTYVCTRPHLATLLIEAGEDVKNTVNVWHPEKSAWAVTLTERAAEMIQAYYMGLDLPAPQFVSEYLLSIGHKVQGGQSNA